MSYNSHVNSLSWDISTNVLTIFLDASYTSMQTITLSTYQGDPSDPNVNPVASVNVTIDGSSSQIVPTAQVFTLLKDVANAGAEATIWVTGYKIAGSTQANIPRALITSQQSAVVEQFLMVDPSENYLTYVSTTVATFDFYSYKNISEGTAFLLTLTDASSISGFTGYINVSANSILQSVQLSGTSLVGPWILGATYAVSPNNTLAFSSASPSSVDSTLTLSQQILSIAPILLPTWNSLQFTCDTSLNSITVVAPKLLFDSDLSNNRYDTPYLGYDSSATLNYAVNYTNNAGLAQRLPSNSASWREINIYADASGFIGITQGVNSSNPTLLYTLRDSITLVNAIKINSIDYYIGNDLGATSIVSGAVVTSPSITQFTTNQLTVKYPLTSTLRYNNNITVQLPTTLTPALGFSSAVVQLLDASGSLVNGYSQEFTYNKTDVSGNDEYNTITMNNASAKSSWYLKVYPIDSLGNIGYNTIIPLTSYVANNVTTAITAVKCSYALDGSLNSLDLSFNTTNSTGASSITVPKNANNYFDASLNYVDGSLNPLAVTSRSRSIAASSLEHNTTYLPVLVNNVTGKLTYPYASNGELDVIVDYIPLSATGNITYGNAYVFEASAGTIIVSQADPSYNTIPMNIVTPNVTTRMFNQPRLISFLALDNTQTLNNVSIITFLVPYFNSTTYNNTYSTYNKNQFLNSYTMYDYVTSTGVINYTPFNTIADASSGLPYTTTYTGTVSGSVSTNQEVIEVALNNSYSTASIPSAINVWGVTTELNLTAIKTKAVTSTIEAFYIDPTVANSMGFNTLEMTYNNLTSGYALGGVTIILFRSGIYVGETYYAVGSLSLVSNTNKSYTLSLSNNLTTVLQGNYTIMAVSNITNGTYGNFNIVSTLNYPSVSAYPKLNSVVTGTSPSGSSTNSNQLRLQISNNFLNPTTLSIDGTQLVTVAQGAIPSRPVNVQLTNNRASTKTLVATLTSGSATNSYNISVSAPGTGNVLVTPVTQTEYNPPLALLPANGLGQNF